jgi:hypothetical protein
LHPRIRGFDTATASSGCDLGRPHCLSATGDQRAGDVLQRRIPQRLPFSITCGFPRGVLPASYRLTIKPPLCQECAKTGRHSPTHRGQGGNQTAAELGICRHHRTVRNTVDRRARIYTPAVGGSIPSAPTTVLAGQRRIAIQSGFTGEPPLCQECAKRVRTPGRLRRLRAGSALAIGGRHPAE